MSYAKPLIVQENKNILLQEPDEKKPKDVALFREVRNQLARFAELVKSPGQIQTYRVTPISL